MKKLALTMVLILAVISLIIAGCGGDSDEEATATPRATPQVTATPGQPVATPMSTATLAPATKTPTSAPVKTATPTKVATSTSGKKLSDIIDQNVGDLQSDMVMTQGGQTFTAKAYWKNAWDQDKMKFRYDMSQQGMTSIILVDYGAQTAYSWLKEQNIAYKMNMSEVPDNPAEDAEQIYPTYLGTETVDGKLCDVYQYTTADGTTKAWIWKDKSFPIKVEVTSSQGTAIIEYKNIVFDTLSDSLFELPSGVQIMQLPT